MRARRSVNQDGFDLVVKGILLDDIHAADEVGFYFVFALDSGVREKNLNPRDIGERVFVGDVSDMMMVFLIVDGAWLDVDAMDFVSQRKELLRGG
jgi:hypothetical protein